MGNAPHVRSDNTFMPDAHGRIQTDDGVTILVLMEGRTPGSGEEEGRQFSGPLVCSGRRLRPDSLQLNLTASAFSWAAVEL